MNHWREIEMQNLLRTICSNIFSCQRTPSSYRLRQLFGSMSSTQFRLEGSRVVPDLFDKSIPELWHSASARSGVDRRIKESAT